MLAEVLIFVPSIARFREDYLLLRLEKAQIASLALLATDGMISTELETELLANADVYNVVLWRDQIRQLILSSPVNSDISATYDLRIATPLHLMRDALVVLVDSQDHAVRVIGHPVQDAGFLIEVTMPTAPLRKAMLDYGLRVFMLSALISVVTASLLFFAVRRLLVLPIRRVVEHMALYADAPEDARRVIAPTSGVVEVREAEEALQSLQTQMTGALRQKERLAQLGSAVAKISHDLRNILTTAQLFADRIEHSVDPVVARIAPKLVGSITRAVSLCESTLAFGKAEEPSPRLSRFALGPLVEEVIEAEALGERPGVSCLVDIPAGLILRADAEQLYRVLANLMRNAMQALEATGKEGVIEVSAGETDSAWWIRVGDTGPGLPLRAREHLFTAFQGSARKGGSGLGLAIAFELVRGHGGRLELLRSDEAGTEFIIHLPKMDGLEDAGQ
ncbi:HAMP domain-containing histidine kinase [Pseudorhodobacter turbinis]|uniref:histidine kinase n=1 Tax=Pseudorhodobacter turbinis TaxID=2500533 RepID=A0A4P8EH88_9RHOB|nr:HAMP domain-containing sensor histidine kinase [Pseudorhodobacter turbinis]QCO56521.1 HAMP domain-containing histidine kinase [Pseudorhodobacter turbinis]